MYVYGKAKILKILRHNLVAIPEYKDSDMPMLCMTRPRTVQCAHAVSAQTHEF